MPIILPFEGCVPRIHAEAWVAPNATLIGDVEIEEGASVWFGCVLRGDVGPIRVGVGSNVQDLTCVHATGGVSSVVIGVGVTVGHGCVLHGCRIEDGALVGMGSVLLDNSVVGAGAVVGAGSLVTANGVVPSRTVAMGRPARVIRPCGDGDRALGVSGARVYRGLAEVYRRG
ncbi:MAG: gamma carbonic anhydrase family protein [Polyangiaceae bacterium]|nr:gamma carbonic anhydrase family protein [Polyangiaceae bacterium]